MDTDLTPASRKRPINLTIREDLVREAKALKLNTSQAAEAGILSAIKDAKTREWLKSNRHALAAHNERVDQSGLLLKPQWLGE